MAGFTQRFGVIQVSPAVAAASADHIFIIAGEADVGHVSRVAKVTLVLRLEIKTEGGAQCELNLSVISHFRSSLTNFSAQGKSKSLMRPKSSPVTMLTPA